MVKNKSDRLHNKGCYHKGQCNVTFFCTKGLSIQTKSAWQPLLPSAKGLSFTFMYLLLCKESKFSFYSFLFFSFGKHHVVRKDLGTYVQLNIDSMSYYCWHHPWGEYVGGRNYKPISFYVQLKRFAHGYEVSISNHRRLYDGWVCGLAKRLWHVTLPEKMMNCSCKVDWEHSLLVSNRVFALHLNCVMNYYLFMRSIW